MNTFDVFCDGGHAANRTSSGGEPPAASYLRHDGSGYGDSDSLWNRDGNGRGAPYKAEGVGYRTSSLLLCTNFSNFRARAINLIVRMQLP